MAAATVTLSKSRRNVAGHYREIAATSVVFAANGDTWAVPGMKQVYEISLTPTTAANFGFTVVGNVLTLASGGTLTFSGTVSGL